MTRNVCFRYFWELFPVISLLFMSIFFKYPTSAKRVFGKLQWMVSRMLILERPVAEGTGHICIVTVRYTGS